MEIKIGRGVGGAYLYKYNGFNIKIGCLDKQHPTMLWADTGKYFHLSNLHPRLNSKLKREVELMLIPLLSYSKCFNNSKYIIDVGSPETLQASAKKNFIAVDL